MQIRSVMTSYGLQLKSGKYRINDISGNIEAVFLKLGPTTGTTTVQHNCVSENLVAKIFGAVFHVASVHFT